eukprot:CAMPEP_0181299850 /NCGR_PEP_ID=MMETSP1101-20121128/6572_1 /TAXON_ID=46948 /ORGANISM="Rhodomonas abbreviata, Strain Caron Lab Isolate" /LENGTH=202 /DNA_ID=CAMNT_0023405039 /DNA_START=57 /DNA_END=661 /DNA_ORIENTATION=-
MNSSIPPIALRQGRNLAQHVFLRTASRRFVNQDPRMQITRNVSITSRNDSLAFTSAFGNPKSGKTVVGMSKNGACRALSTISDSDNSTGGGFQKAPGQNVGETVHDPGSGPSPKERMAIVFSCVTCDARVTRTFTKRSYERGVVIVRVEKEDGCTREDGKDHCLHLIADNLGWFEDQPVNIETLMARRGEGVQRLKVRETTG